MRLVTDKQAITSYYGGVFIDEIVIVINYKLAKEIGATHHIEDLLYKFNDSGVVMCYFSEYGWEKTENKSAHMAELERIDFKKCTQPKHTRTEYERVTESIFDLRDEFERGELYSDKDGKFKVEGLAHLGACCQTGLIYRRVEKEVDERQEFIEAACSVIEDCHGERRQYVVEALFDSGKFKLSDN